MSTLGSIYAEKQVEADLQQQPIEICNWDKRKKCDSLYIQKYRKLEKEVEISIELLDKALEKKIINIIYKPAIIEIRDRLEKLANTNENIVNSLELIKLDIFKRNPKNLQRKLQKSMQKLKVKVKYGKRN